MVLGHLLWAKQFGTEGNDAVRALVVKGGGLYAAGAARGSLAVRPDALSEAAV